MNSRYQIAVAVRRTLVMSAIATAATMSAHAEEPVKVETITVTGSRIARPDFTAPSPVVTLQSDAYKMSGEVQLESVLNTLPQLVPSVTTTSNNPSNGGQSNVNLRGLGNTRTLVLLNGTRLTSSNTTGVVDLNTIPAALIDNIEILTGGASSTYGSDAVAGVVNVKLKQNFSGVQIDMQQNRTSRSDGKTSLIEGVIGGNFADSRGNAVVSFSWDKRDDILAGARPFSQVGLGSALTPSGSGTVPDGSVSFGANTPSQAAINSVFVSKYGATAGQVLPSNTEGFNPDGSLFSFGNLNNAATPVVNYKGNKADIGFNPVGYSYNFAPVNNLQLPLERRQVAAFTHLDLMPESNGMSVQTYGRLMYTSYHADQQLASTPVTCTGTQAGCAVPVTSSALPADLKTIAASRTVNPTANLTFFKRYTEMGPRAQENDYDTLQGLVGLRGGFQFAGRDFNWDVFGSWGRVNNTSLQGGNISRSKLQAALTNPAVYAAQGCANFNPFGAGTLSPACANQIAILATNLLTVEETNLVGSLSGDVVQLPAGAMKFAVGAEYREDKAKFRPDSYLASGDVVGFNAQQPVSGGIRVREPFAELSVPLLADKPFAQYLGLDLGYRNSHYNLAGGANTFKADVEWNPIKAVKFRGGFNRSIRAPNVNELFLPVQENFPSATDPCSATSTFRAASNPDKAKVEALCVAQGIPAATLTTYGQPNSQIKSFIGGSQTLKPEVADGYSFGFVFNPSSESDWLHRFNMSVDYYKIKIDDVIASLTTSSVLGRCFNQLGANPTFDANNQFCQLFHRDTATLGATDVQTITRNLSAWKTSGVDLNVDWRLPLSAFAGRAPGDLGVQLLYSRLLTREQQETGVDPFFSRQGTISSTLDPTSTFPKNKATMALSYSVHTWQFRYNVRYISRMDVVNPDAVFSPSTGAKPYVPNYFYHDIAVRWNATDNFGVTGGVTNIADKMPPVYTTSTAAGIQDNTDPSTYDVLGRRYFLSLVAKF